MKVFGIGRSRTGTTSLSVALGRLGLHALRFPRTRKMIGSIDAVTDTPVAAWYRELDAAYPGSKFILTLRHLPDWLDSCEALWQASFPFFDEFTSGIHRQLYGREDFDRVAFGAAYARHRADVLTHFTGRERDLLLMDVCSGEGWERLCPFLGLDQPSTPFPRRNTRADIGLDWVSDCPACSEDPDAGPLAQKTGIGQRDQTENMDNKRRSDRIELPGGSALAMSATSAASNHSAIAPYTCPW